ncbi:MAG: Holliday junction branch migration protein RuvA [Bacteroidales bacterium]|nr:Holliday junction branch migration protein RuvA [Bacteroidales bacterium]
MIDYLRGPLAEVTPTAAIIDCGGVGYEANINLIDYAAIQGKKEVKLFIHEVIAEDKHILFGFGTRADRDMFRLLIGVSGVGPNTARLIMSSLSVRDLENVIATGQESMLKAVKGIGARTAQRIIVDLKDKIKSGGDTLLSQAPAMTQTYDESLQALLMLGFAKPQTEKALKKIFSSTPTISVEDSVKQALKMM